jgi:hypothetical protein
MSRQFPPADTLVPGTFVVAVMETAKWRLKNIEGFSEPPNSEQASVWWYTRNTETEQDFRVTKNA